MKRKDPGIIHGIAAAAGTTAAGVLVGLAADQVNSTLNEAAGKNRQKGDKWNLFVNVSSDMSKMSSANVKALISGNGVSCKETCNRILTLFHYMMITKKSVLGISYKVSTLTILNVE
eukprot:TRINITY_DN16667_c0_g1_i1.p2 TRINITY_DN16667_c0_g1~~TRINITY_DN16667_c0_g1_i1.p2  ORF type:complete len:137 (-),score=24.57 TRINITY_DN16667_c0_g1_i1:448-798(-)